MVHRAAVALLDHGKGVMMKKPSQIFSIEERAEIKNAISIAESKTYGVIVHVVVASSGRYDRAEDIVGIIIGLITLSIYWSFFQLPAQTGWFITDTVNPALWPVLLIIVIAFIAGTILATLLPVLRLLFISKTVMKEEVERSALETFQRQRIRATRDGTGILIYLSLYEQMVCVIGDDAINSKVEPDDWQSICDIITKGMKDNKPEPALVDAITQSGDLLTKHFPVGDDDQNELNNELILIDD